MINFYIRLEFNLFSSNKLIIILIFQLNALEYIHENAYVHADIKGANILCGYENPNEVFTYF